MDIKRHAFFALVRSANKMPSQPINGLISRIKYTQIVIYNLILSRVCAILQSGTMMDNDERAELHNKCENQVANGTFCSICALLHLLYICVSMPCSTIYNAKHFHSLRTRWSIHVRTRTTSGKQKKNHIAAHRKISIKRCLRFINADETCH